MGDSSPDPSLHKISECTGAAVARLQLSRETSQLGSEIQSQPHLYILQTHPSDFASSPIEKDRGNFRQWGKPKHLLNRGASKAHSWAVLFLENEA